MGFLKRFRFAVLLLILPLSLFYVGYRPIGPETAGMAAYRNHNSLLANMGRMLLAGEKATGELGNRLERAVPAPNGIAPPADFVSTNTGGRVIFAQIADGPIGYASRFDRTAFTIANDSGYAANGRLEFFNDGGSPITLTVDGVTASTFPIQLSNGETKTLTTSGAGTTGNGLITGWALITTDQPVAATCGFSIRDAAGVVYGDVGVEESLLGKKFTLLADSKGDADTGLALINPDTASPLTVSAELRDTAGVKIASADLTLPARGHRALFITELFNKVAGIQEFEGVVVVTAGRPFGGITLRMVGLLMTSVPLIAEARVGDPVSPLVFPQIADGQDAGIKSMTSVLLFSQSTKTTQVTLEFFGSDGIGLPVTIDGQRKSSFSITINPGGVRRLVTDGSGAMRVGWARVTTDQQLAGAAIYHFSDMAGALLSEVGVPSALPLETLNAIAVSQGSVQTGIAFANNNDPSESPMDINLNLLDSRGTEVLSKSIQLGPMEHQALFIHQLFSEVAGITNFQGRLVIGGGSGLAVLTVRQIRAMTTSVPTLAPQHGFAPISVLEFAQNLTGTAPTVRWRIDMPAIDLALNSIKVEAPALGLDTTAIKAGDEVGYGYYFINYPGWLSMGGIVKLIATATGTIQFDTVASGPGVTTGAVIMTGRMSGQPASGLTLELGPTDAKNADWNEGYGLELDLTLRAGLIKSPPAAGKVDIKTTYESASTKATEDGVAITRQTSQGQTFAAAVTGAPFIVSQKPAFFSGGGRVTLTGGNWGTQPKITFRRADGTDSVAWADEVLAGSLKVIVPDDAVDGLVTVMNGASKANDFSSRTLFGPDATLTQSPLAGGTYSLTCKITQAAPQLSLQWFELRLFNTAWVSTGLTTGAKLGTMTLTGGSTAANSTTYDVLVESVTATTVKLILPKQGQTDPVWRIDMVKTDASSAGALVLTAKPVTLTDQPTVNGYPSMVELTLPNLSLSTLAPAAPVFWTAGFMSGPSDILGQETGLFLTRETVAIK